MIDLSGVFPPIPTPFEPDQTLALPRLRDNLRRLSRFDLTGFLVLGSNGEMVMLSEPEKRQVLEAAREAIPRDKLMLAGSGAQSTRETIQLTKMAAEAGADAALVLNPSYFKGLMTKEALVSHYKEVADSSPIPVIMYNMPACSGLDMSAEIIAEASHHPNVVGIKDSGGNIAKLGTVLGNAAPGFQFLTGSATVLLAALAVGAVGGILALANIAPQQCLDIYRSFKNGDIERARELQIKMMPVISAVAGVGGVPDLKAAMDYLGLYGGPCRKPIQPIKPETRAALIRLLDDNQIKL